MAALLIEDLHKRYGRSRAVQGVSLRVERGQLYGLVGPNGSGKTTTLSCALGLLRPDRGRLEVLGVPSRAIHRTAGKVAVVFDQPTLVNGLSVRQNLAYARRLLGHRGGRSDAEALKLVELDDMPRHRAGRLSLGQSRRLSIARALIGRPELLILDEPLSGLDTVGVRAMLRLFTRLRDEGLTLVLSSHRLHELERIVSHVAILLAGRVVRQAPLDELLGERSRLVTIRSADIEAARRVLTGLAGPTRVEQGTDDDELRVDVGNLDVADVNRALVENGVPVAALVPERHTLQAVFESLLNAELDGEGEP